MPDPRTRDFARDSDIVDELECRWRHDLQMFKYELEIERFHRESERQQHLTVITKWVGLGAVATLPFVYAGALVALT